MNFAAAMTTFEVGAYVAVSDGTAAPSIKAGPAWWAWRSHNFIGRLVEKTSGSPRKLKFELAKASAATVSYLVCETVPHQFTLSDEASFQNDANSVLG